MDVVCGRRRGSSDRGEGAWRRRDEDRSADVAAAGAIAAALGPVIGGAFTTYASWRWVFAGEVLIVLVILLLARRVNDIPAEEGVRLDVVGTALSALGLGLVVLGVLRSGRWGFVQPKPDAPEWLGLSPVNLASTRPSTLTPPAS
jgi:MFS family permease